PHRAVLTPHYDDALAPDRAAHVITRVGDLGFPSDAHPTSREDALLLLREHLGRVVITARQRALALLIRLGGFDERRHGVKASEAPTNRKWGECVVSGKGIGIDL